MEEITTEQFELQDGQLQDKTEQGWHKRMWLWIQESVAGPIQMVQHPGPVSKDPGEGKSISSSIPMEKISRHLRAKGLLWSGNSRGHRWKEIFVHHHMWCTFSLRCDEIVNLAPPVLSMACTLLWSTNKYKVTHPRTSIHPSCYSSLKKGGQAGLVRRWNQSWWLLRNRYLF